MTQSVRISSGATVLKRGVPVVGYQPPPGAVWLDQNRATLAPDQWVAANEQGVVAFDTSVEGLMAKVEQRRLTAADVTVAFISPPLD